MVCRIGPAPGIHVCHAGNAWIFLDVPRDRYTCLTGRPAEVFSELVECPDTQSLSPAASALARKLTECGLLAEGSAAVRPAKAPQMEAPRQSLSPENETSAAAIRPSEWAAFLFEFARCAHLQDPKRRKLSRIIREAELCKQKVARASLAGSHSAEALTRSFHRIAPWFFTSHDACFFSSYLLLRFLARFGIAADWIFAVRLSPFRAHCWVAHAGTLLNEELHVAAGYQPVLVV